jgi:hypothetical protein
MNKVQRILATLSLFGLAACGSGGGSSQPTTQTVTGVVADGYLSGATVCLDTNLNKQCDSGEPTGTTGVGGAYTIPNVSIADLAKYPIVVVVPPGAEDSERGTVASGYVMSAPAGNPGFVSPLTTLVQSQMETSGQSLTDAVATIKTQLRLTALSPLDDYKPGTTTTDEATVAAGVAKVIATSLAENKKAIEDAIGSGTPITSQQVVNLTVQQAMQYLSTMVDQVKSATNNGKAPLTEDSVSGVVSSCGASISTSDTAALQQQLADSAPKSPATSMKLTLSLQGSNAASVKAIQAVITLPAGVTLRAGADGAPLAGVLAGLGGAASAPLLAKYTKAIASSPATLTIGFITTGNLIAGDILTINTDLAAGTSAPAAAAFAITSKLIDFASKEVVGASLTAK